MRRVTHEELRVTRRPLQAYTGLLFVVRCSFGEQTRRPHTSNWHRTFSAQARRQLYLCHSLRCQDEQTCPSLRNFPKPASMITWTWIAWSCQAGDSSCDASAPEAMLASCRKSKPKSWVLREGLRLPNSGSASMKLDTDGWTSTGSCCGS